MPSLDEAFIFDAIRTPLGRGKSAGKLHTQTPLGLVSSLLREMSRRYPPVVQATDEVILGCCEQYNDQGGNLARASALQAGYQVTTPGLMVSRFCGSGLDAVNTAAAKVMSGQGDLIIAGGIEMLSLFSIFGSGGPMISDVSFKDTTVQIPRVCPLILSRLCRDTPGTTLMRWAQDPSSAPARPGATAFLMVGLFQ